MFLPENTVDEREETTFPYMHKHFPNFLIWLSIANPISCLDSVPCNLSKSLRGRGILWHHSKYGKFMPYKLAGDTFMT